MKLQEDHPQWYSIGMAEHMTDMLVRESQARLGAKGGEGLLSLWQCTHARGIPSLFHLCPLLIGGEGRDGARQVLGYQ